jgi:hypothetical protein
VIVTVAAAVDENNPELAAVSLNSETVTVPAVGVLMIIAFAVLALAAAIVPDRPFAATVVVPAAIETIFASAPVTDTSARRFATLTLYPVKVTVLAIPATPTPALNGATGVPSPVVKTSAGAVIVNVRATDTPSIATAVSVITYVPTESGVNVTVTGTDAAPAPLPVNVATWLDTAAEPSVTVPAARVMFAADFPEPVGGVPRVAVTGAVSPLDTEVIPSVATTDASVPGTTVCVARLSVSVAAVESALEGTADRTPRPNAATATSAMRLKVVFVDICFLSISQSQEFPALGFG